MRPQQAYHHDPKAQYNLHLQYLKLYWYFVLFPDFQAHLQLEFLYPFLYIGLKFGQRLHSPDLHLQYTIAIFDKFDFELNQAFPANKGLVYYILELKC